MNRDDNIQHAEQVELWVKKTIKDKPPGLQVQLLADLIKSLQQQIVFKLSKITWNAILDRALIQSQQKFPFLADIKIEPEGILMEGTSPDFEIQQPGQVSEAFRFFLIEVLTIIEKLTAGILMESIYRTLADFEPITHGTKIEKGVKYGTETIRRTH